MPQPMVAGLPPWLDLEAGSIIRLSALDPTTGLAVSGVSLSEVSFFVRDEQGSAADDDNPEPLLVPSGEPG